MKTYKAQSTEVPIRVDLTNDKVVFVNENPTVIASSDPKMYEYDVKEYTKNEYIESVLRLDAITEMQSDIVEAMMDEYNAL